MAVFCFLAAGTAVWAETPAQPELHGGFVFTSTKKGGRLEWKVEGSSATFITPENVELEDVRAVYFADDGTKTIATTKKAMLNKETRHVDTDEFVTIITANSVITAEGMSWNQEDKKGLLKRDVKVVYTSPGGKGVIP